MSSLFRSALPKEVPTVWRKHLGTNAGQLGIDWLRRNSPSATGQNLTELTESALIWKGYQMALDDVEDKLTAIVQVPQSLDEPPLETPEPRQK